MTSKQRNRGTEEPRMRLGFLGPMSSSWCPRKIELSMDVPRTLLRSTHGSHRRIRSINPPSSMKETHKHTAWCTWCSTSTQSVVSTRTYSPYLGSQYSSQYTHTRRHQEVSTVPSRYVPSTVSVEARVKRTKCIFRLVDRKDRKLS